MRHIKAALHYCHPREAAATVTLNGKLNTRTLSRFPIVQKREGERKGGRGGFCAAVTWPSCQEGR